MNDQAELARRFLDGDPDVARAVTAWARAATWSFRSRLGDDWEDVHHQTLVELTEELRRGSYRGDGNFKAFVRRIATTSCLDRVRARRRWRWVELDDAILPPVADVASRVAERQHVATVVARVLAAVPEECLRLWRMIVEGLSYREMSRALQVTEGALRVRVLRCRRRALAERDRLLGNESSPETPERAGGDG